MSFAFYFEADVFQQVTEARPVAQGVEEGFGLEVDDEEVVVAVGRFELSHERTVNAEITGRRHA
ncbi:MAG: hypothetical protein H0T45_15600 [Pyrinomonadaceae bacterium]|nr:hypothetical protein [Pyrinomonadaceae bacterium]